MTTTEAEYLPITTTYLELQSPGQLRPALLDDPELLLLNVAAPTVAYYRFLYDAVGRDFDWTDRLYWPDERLAAHLQSPTVAVFVLHYQGHPAGYVELVTEPDEPGETGTEIAYLGVFPAYHGRGFGKHLLTLGAQQAFAAGAERVWLHTCTLDGPTALPNYQARGMTIYKTTTGQQRVDRNTESYAVGRRQHDV